MNDSIGQHLQEPENGVKPQQNLQADDRAQLPKLPSQSPKQPAGNGPAAPRPGRTSKPHAAGSSDSETLPTRNSRVKGLSPLTFRIYFCLILLSHLKKSHTKINNQTSEYRKGAFPSGSLKGVQVPWVPY